MGFFGAIKSAATKTGSAIKKTANAVDDGLGYVPGYNIAKSALYGPKATDLSAVEQNRKTSDEMRKRFAEQYNDAAGNPSVAPTMQGPSGEYQKLAADRALATMNGQTPSLAEMQLRQGTRDAVAAQQSMAAGARGPGALMARRQAMANTAGLNAQVNNQAAMLRAQEADAAQKSLLAATGQMQEREAANLTSQLKMRGYDDEEAYRLATLMLNSNSQGTEAALGIARTRAADEAAKGQHAGQMINAIGGTAATLLKEQGGGGNGKGGGGGMPMLFGF